MATRHETHDCEDTVVVDYEHSPVYTTYTRGTRDPLYSGDSEEAAAASLEMTMDEFNGLLMSDGFHED